MEKLTEKLCDEMQEKKAIIEIRTDYKDLMLTNHEIEMLIYDEMRKRAKEKKYEFSDFREFDVSVHFEGRDV